MEDGHKDWMEAARGYGWKLSRGLEQGRSGAGGEGFARLPRSRLCATGDDRPWQNLPSQKFRGESVWAPFPKDGPLPIASRDESPAGATVLAIPGRPCSARRIQESALIRRPVAAAGEGNRRRVRPC